MVRSSRQQCNIDSVTREALPNFVDMRFDSSQVGEVAWSNHQHSQYICTSNHSSDPFHYRDSLADVEESIKFPRAIDPKTPL